MYTDTACRSMPGAPVVKPAGANLPERKAFNDARVQRDRQLADQLEADRLGSLDAARAAQDRQLQVDRDVAGRVQGERDARNAATTSILQPSVCTLCRTNQ